MRADSKRPSQRAGKETLIGVAPQMFAGLITPSQQPPESSSPPPAHSSPAGPSSSRPPSRNVNDRSMKATLVGGIGISPVPTPLSQPAAKPKANATLMGVSPSEPPRNLAGAQTTLGMGAHATGSLGAADQRTVQGVPREPGTISAQPPSTQPSGRRHTQKGMVSQAPGVSPDAVSRAPTRNVASGALDEQRINSAWQERADDLSARTLRGMSPPERDDFVPGAPRIPRTEGRLHEFGERLSDIPTQMRDPASFESRRPSRGFPWRYVGVLVLTAVAYFAWLYLLDHM